MSNGMLKKSIVILASVGTLAAASCNKVQAEELLVLKSGALEEVARVANLTADILVERNYSVDECSKANRARLRSVKNKAEAERWNHAADIASLKYFAKIYRTGAAYYYDRAESDLAWAKRWDDLAAKTDRHIADLEAQRSRIILAR
ncbi:MAG: hypothetical protein HY074_05620 [Deltaproteobacteria bacterium]|nr:hypothetical protein [Deltaproteobacteria bacterium]